MNHLSRLIIAGLLIFQASLNANAQQNFTKVFQDPQGAIQAYSIEKTRDGNYLIAGEKDDRPMALKMDPTGNILWCKNIGSSSGKFNTITATRDSCFVLAGDIYPSTSNNLFCVKLNSAGDTLWTRMIDMGYDDEVYSIKQTLDGGFILTGDASQSKVVVVKLDAGGNLSWGRLLTGGTLSNYGNGIEQASDSSYFVTGTLENQPVYDKAMFIMKLTPAGSFSWAKKQLLTGQNYSSGNDLKIIPDGLMLCFNETDLGIVLMKTDFSGNFLWARSYPGFGYQFLGLYPKFHRTSSGGYMFVRSDPFSPAGFLNVDSVGNVLGSQTLTLIATDVAESYEGGYMILGNGPIQGCDKQQYNPQVGIIRTDADGNGPACTQQADLSSDSCIDTLTDVTFSSQSAGTVSHISISVTNVNLTTRVGCVDVTGGIEEQSADQISVSVYPNPSSGAFSVLVTGAANTGIQRIDVFNSNGAKVFSSTGTIKQGALIDIGSVPEGVYTVRVTCNKASCSQKIVICH
jgi:hypothetical protein